jgi:hypothetical protein
VTIRIAGACALIASIVACTSTSLVLPGQIRALPDVAETRDAILVGMETRGWIFADEEPGRILARLDIRRHTAETWIAYDESSIRFSYAGSQNLDCWRSGDSCRSIHRKYNGWTRNLANSIASEVSKRRVSQGRRLDRESE